MHKKCYQENNRRHFFYCASLIPECKIQIWKLLIILFTYQCHLQVPDSLLWLYFRYSQLCTSSKIMFSWHLLWHDCWVIFTSLPNQRAFNKSTSFKIKQSNNRMLVNVKLNLRAVEKRYYFLQLVISSVDQCYGVHNSVLQSSFEFDAGLCLRSNNAFNCSKFTKPQVN